jgi:hypothetical protein
MFIKAVLESITFYWLSINYVSKGLLNKIRIKCYSFLWTRRRETEGIPLAKWTRISKPKEAGGWELKNIFAFSQALPAKSLWRMLLIRGNGAK